MFHHSTVNEIACNVGSAVVSESMDPCSSREQTTIKKIFREIYSNFRTVLLMEQHGTYATCAN